MNYYSEIKRELINNEVNKKVKDYSKNKYELETYLRVGKLLMILKVEKKELNMAMD